jgi:hypothetical protein
MSYAIIWIWKTHRCLSIQSQKNLFRIYSDPDLDDTVQNAILASLKKRWKAADQDVFIMAVFLNPYICRHCFNHTALTEANLYNIVACIFECIFSQKADLDMLKSSQTMHKARQSSQAQTYHLIRWPQYTSQRWIITTDDILHDMIMTEQNQPLDLVLIWT